MQHVEQQNTHTYTHSTCCIATYNIKMADNSVVVSASAMIIVGVMLKKKRGKRNRKVWVGCQKK